MEDVKFGHISRRSLAPPGSFLLYRFVLITVLLACLDIVDRRTASQSAKRVKIDYFTYQAYTIFMMAKYMYHFRFLLLTRSDPRAA